MSLSDKEVKIINPNGEKGISFYFPAGEVKEFIKELKDLGNMGQLPNDVLKNIDKLAGDKLIWKQKQ